MRDPNSRRCFVKSIKKLLAEIITDLNAEIEQLGKDFDYRGKPRDEEWCKRLAKNCRNTYEISL